MHAAANNSESSLRCGLHLNQRPHTSTPQKVEGRTYMDGLLVYRDLGVLVGGISALDFSYRGLQARLDGYAQSASLVARELELIPSFSLEVV